MDFRQTVGANARKYRLAADLTQEEVAERMGVDRAYISGLERGQRNPTVITLWHIAQALEVKTAQLLEEVDAAEVRPTSERQRATRKGNAAKRLHREAGRKRP